MSKYLYRNQDGVIYVESDNGDIFGIVSALKITDHGGIPYNDDALTVLEREGFQLDQDWESDATYIDFYEENGETARVLFNGDDVNIVEL